MRTNLSEGGGNAYWRVTESFGAYVLVGYSESNTYFGASMALGNVYRRVALAAGDEIHALVGGTFVVTGSGVHAVRYKLSEKHPFEKTYLPGREEWPLDRLEPCGDDRRIVGSYRKDLPKLSPGSFVGRGIDSVLP